jgi:ribosomal protein S27AE
MRIGPRRGEDKHLPGRAAKPFILNVMNDEILKKLEARLDRRSFLRGSSLGVAALLGVAAASPLVVFAQSQDKPPADDKKKADEKKDQDDPKDEEKHQPIRVEGKDGRFYDRDGVEVRECPECGHNMYQQGRTWTCENCGYSYIE